MRMLEQRLLEVLEAKINLFELVVGELDMIFAAYRMSLTSSRWSFRSTSPAATTLSSERAWRSWATSSHGRGPNTSAPASGSTSWSPDAGCGERARAQLLA